MPWKPDLNPRLLTESEQRSPILPAAEVQLLVDDLHAELTMEVETAEVRFQLARFDSLLESFVQDWRQLCAQHGQWPRPPGFRPAGRRRAQAQAGCERRQSDLGCSTLGLNS